MVNFIVVEKLVDCMSQPYGTSVREPRQDGSSSDKRILVGPVASWLIESIPPIIPLIIKIIFGLE